MPPNLALSTTRRGGFLTHGERRHSVELLVTPERLARWVHWTRWSMLIIARRKGQRVVIGRDIEVVVTEVTRAGIKLGIIAPPHTTILRGELHDAVEAANRAAAEAGGEPPEPTKALPSQVPLGKPT